MALNNTNPSFPAPYVNKTEAADPMMKRVPMDHMDIGARSSGLPKNEDRLPSIDHVGGSAGSK
jgi:hypothetical protein